MMFMKTYIKNEDSNEIRDFDCKPDLTAPREHRCNDFEGI